MGERLVVPSLSPNVGPGLAHNVGMCRVVASMMTTNEMTSWIAMQTVREAIWFDEIFYRLMKGTMNHKIPSLQATLQAPIVIMLHTFVQRYPFIGYWKNLLKYSGAQILFQNLTYNILEMQKKKNTSVDVHTYIGYH